MPKTRENLKTDSLSIGTTRSPKALKTQVQLLWAALEAATTRNTERKILNQLLSFVREQANADAGTVMRFDSKKKQLEFVTVQGKVSSKLKGYKMPASRGIAGWVATKGQPALVPDVDQDERYNNTVAKETHYETRDMVCVPIFCGGKVVGVLQLLNHDAPRHFRKTDLGLCQAAAEVMAIVFSASGAVDSKGR